MQILDATENSIQVVKKYRDAFACKARRSFIPLCNMKSSNLLASCLVLVCKQNLCIFKACGERERQLTFS